MFIVAYVLVCLVIASLNPTTAYFSSSSAAAAAGGGGGGGGNDEGNCEYCVKCELPECNITKAKNKLLVLCDTCSVSIHLECLNLTGVPNQTRWSCPYCIETEKRQLMRKRTFKINDPVDVHVCSQQSLLYDSQTMYTCFFFRSTETSSAAVFSHLR